MKYDNDDINDIYDRTNGKCHICGKKLSFKNYGRNGRRGAWHVDHSSPQAFGGSDHLNNLFPACISCNLLKGTASTRTARRWHGRKRAPLSREKRSRAKFATAMIGAGIGGLIGARGGRQAAVTLAVIGASIGHRVDPDT